MKRKSFLYIILAGILWGTSGLFVHMLAPAGLSSIQITSIRGTVAAICMVVYVLFYDRKLFRVTAKELLLYACSGVSIFLTSSSYFYSLQASSVATAVVLMYTAPVFVMIYSVSFMGEKITRNKLISLLLMMLGSCLVSGIIGGFKYSTLGIIFGFVAGLAYSAYNVFTKVQMRNKCNPISASMYSFIFMSLSSLIMANPMEIAEITVARPDSIIFMIGCGICTCVLPYFLYTVALKYLPVGTASALGIIEPMAATVFSVLILGESLSIYTLCGVILILTAVYILSKSRE